MKATDNSANAKYNDEVLFLDGIVQFHPEVWQLLSTAEQEVLKMYYLTHAGEIPDNVFSYRKELLRSNPEIEAKAGAIFRKVLKKLGIRKFNYSTKSKD